MIVYRFEQDNGLGPWAGRGSSEYDRAAYAVGSYQSCSDMPCLMSRSEEGSPAHSHYVDNGAMGYLFGFTSQRQLKAAFPSAAGRAAMGEVGIRLNKYEVPDADVLRSPSQCIFPKGAGTKIAVLDLKTLKEKE